MNKEDLNNELKPEYDLASMKVRKIGAGRRLMQENEILLDVDVARMFPTSEAVNEALRFLVRITKQHQTELQNK